MRKNQFFKRTLLGGVFVLLMTSQAFTQIPESVFDTISRKVDSSLLYRNMPVNPMRYIQTSDENTRIKISGFLRTDAYYDSRQMMGAGELIAVVMPKAPSYDANGNDINNAPGFQMASIISRLSLDVTGGEILGAKSSGILEAEFFGNSGGNVSINEFRLRHAWIKLDWKNTQLGIGQYFHPLINLLALPNTVNYTTGSPFFPVNRNPQIRLTHTIGKLTSYVTVMSQRDFTPSTIAYRNAAMPAFNFHTFFRGGNAIIGATFQYERIQPNIVSGSPAVATNEDLSSFSAMLYAKVITKPLAITGQITAMQNASSYTAFGGYVGYIMADGTPEQFRTMNSNTTWLDFQFTGKKIYPGLFLGYGINHGAKDIPIGAQSATAYGLIANWGGFSANPTAKTARDMFKITPRLDLRFGKLLFRVEADYMNVNYVDAEMTGTGTENSIRVASLRGHFVTIFFF
ncbi:DcaP family trimeric outer membrane transporter [Pedobacter sp. AW1-32]|uniref:DcaP family trimeric outer membrane transporter n=1 Tax=Pedobacter sp. AW1-32 TaxID=3383026 RepID=UPI003FF08980